MSSLWSSPLVKVAFCTGVFVTGAVTWMENRLQNNFRKQDYYQEPLAMLQRYEPVAQFLGRPIYAGRVDLTDDSKFKVELVKAKVSIPLKGPKGKGVLHVLASRQTPADKWNIDLLDLEILNTKQRWTFYDQTRAEANVHVLQSPGTQTDSV